MISHMFTTENFLKSLNSENQKLDQSFSSDENDYLMGQAQIYKNSNPCFTFDISYELDGDYKMFNVAYSTEDYIHFEMAWSDGLDEDNNMIFDFPNHPKTQ